METRLRSVIGLVIVLAALAPALTGCKTTQPRSALMEKTPNLAQSPERLRIQVRSLVPLMLGIMESAADEVLASTNDPRIRSAALHFKADGIPTMYRALFQPDPVAAVLDAWVLVAQMRAFFETGKGKEMPNSQASSLLSSNCRQPTVRLGSGMRLALACSSSIRCNSVPRRRLAAMPVT